MGHFHLRTATSAPGGYAAWLVAHPRKHRGVPDPHWHEALRWGGRSRAEAMLALDARQFERGLVRCRDCSGAGCRTCRRRGFVRRGA